MVELNDRHVTFRVKCPQAVRVFLVGDFDQGPSQVLGMDRVDGDTWQAEMDLQPGEYHFCYYLYDGRTIRYQPDTPLRDASCDEMTRKGDRWGDASQASPGCSVIETDGVKSVLRVGSVA